MQYSTNYNIKLMEGTDKVKRQDFVDNFTTIDTQMKNIDNKHSAYGTTSGTNSYTVNITGITSYYDGLKVVIKIGTTCTGNSSLNINNLGAKTILDGSGNVITSGSLKAGIPYNLCYNGTNFILLGKGGGGGGTATANQILSGQTATTNNGLITGTMPNNGAVSSTINCSGTYTIPAGYHNGSGKITANSLASQTPATATAAHMLSGKTAWVNGTLITGNIPNIQSKTFVPTTTYQTINANQFIASPLFVQGDANLVGGNIISGKSIFGVNGTATIQSMGGSAFTSGTGTVVLEESQSRILVDFSAKVPSTVRVIWGKFTSGSSFYFVNFRSGTSGTFKPIVWDKYYSKYADENSVAITGINLGDGDSSHTWSAGTYTYTWYAI